MTEIYCIEYIYAKDGMAEKLKAELLNLVELSRLEEGCLQYDLLCDESNPLLFIIILRFKSIKHMELHEKSNHVLYFVDHYVDTLCDKIVWNNAYLIS